MNKATSSKIATIKLIPSPDRNDLVGQPGAEVGNHAAGKRSQEEGRANEGQDK